MAHPLWSVTLCREELASLSLRVFYTQTSMERLVHARPCAWRERRDERATSCLEGPSEDMWTESCSATWYLDVSGWVLNFLTEETNSVWSKEVGGFLSWVRRCLMKEGSRARKWRL